MSSPDLMRAVTPVSLTSVTIAGGSSAIVGIARSASCQRASASSAVSSSRGPKRRSGPRQPWRQS